MPAVTQWLPPDACVATDSYAALTERFRRLMRTETRDNEELLLFLLLLLLLLHGNESVAFCQAAIYCWRQINVISGVRRMNRAVRVQFKWVTAGLATGRSAAVCAKN